MGITAANFRAHSKNTLKGFVDLQLEPSGLVIKDATWHERNGKEWVGLPGKPQVEDGRLRMDERTSKPLYTNVIEFTNDEAKATFQTAAVKAIYRLLGQGSPPPPANDGHPFA